VTAGVQPARLARLQPQRRGRRGGRGDLTAILQDCCTPIPSRGGRQVAGRVSECRRRAPYPTRVSSVLTRISSVLARVSSVLPSFHGSRSYKTPLKRLH
jgi:hypothetical protein